MAELHELLLRGEAERIFLSRKSTSGSTGYYDGQFEALRPYKRQALDLVVAILGDRALPAPGRPIAGRFEFLRPPREEPVFEEIQGMAANAFNELVTPFDTAYVKAVGSLYDQAELAYDMDPGDPDAIAVYSDLLLAMYLVFRGREPYGSAMERFLQSLDGWSRRGVSRSLSVRAGLLLRLGRYEEAIDAYERAILYDPLVVKVIVHYNMACAYASWSRKLEGRARDEKRTQALDQLEKAVDHLWSDVSWMEEDRDLDPLRDHPRYQALVRRIQREVRPEADGR
jgi:tetratricopeptide (TPR) repeat protein